MHSRKENYKVKVLDVGCGQNKKEGAIGIDHLDLPSVDVVHDLNKFPWPFETETFDEIYFYDSIEHLQDTMKVMAEVRRLLKKGGTVTIRVVYWNHRYSYTDPTHIHAFSEDVWTFFTGERRGYYTETRFEMVDLKFNYDNFARRLCLGNTWLMDKLAYFLCNVHQGMTVVLRK